MEIIMPLLLQIVLIGLNAIFACAEIAIISMSEVKINKLITDGNRKAKLLQKLTSNPAKFLATIQIAITLSGFLGSAFAADNFAGMLVNYLSHTGIITKSNINIFNTISVILITLILSYFTLVFGELVPKRLAMRKAEGIAISLSAPLYYISKLFTPVVWLLTISTNCILRLMGIDPNKTDDNVSEEDIKLMVDDSSEKGYIEKQEQEMIRNIFEFNDILVGEFDTHRTEVEFLWEDDDIKEWDKIIKSSFHKHYPICKNSEDNIIGILNTKEYFKLNEKSKKEILEKAVLSPYFVPETTKADLLFTKMKQTKNKFAVVLDEHGGVEGVVTIDDILEQIVGDFNNLEENTEEIIIKQLTENKWEIIGHISIEDANATFGTKFSDEECDTFGGLIFSEYGSIPSDNETFEIQIENLKVVINEIKEHRIARMIVEKLEKTNKKENIKDDER